MGKPRHRPRRLRMRLRRPCDRGGFQPISFTCIEEILMKRFLFAMAVIVVAIVGVGYYLGWFQIGSDRTGGRDRITLTVDEDKFKADEKKAHEKVHDLGQRAKDAAAGPARTNKD